MITSSVRTCQRSFKIIQLPANGSKGLVRVTIDGKSADYSYDVLRVDAEFGECAVELKKLDPETFPPYHVLLAADGSASCDCMGFLRWSDRAGKDCKHCALARPLVSRTNQMIAQREREAAQSAVASSRLTVRKQSEQTLAVESADGKPVASIECASGLTDDHVRSANHIVANPAGLAEPERLQANVEQLPETVLMLPAFACKADGANCLRIVDGAGRDLIVIECNRGINDQHNRIAALIVREPRHLNYPAAFKASFGNIPGTTVKVA